MGKQLFNVKGMLRDIDPTKSVGTYAYEIRNLRLTAQEDSTLLALTTEKGNTEYSLNPENSILGNIVGYCVLNNYIVIFTTEGIFRLEEKDNTTLNVATLFVGNLGFTEDSILETLGIYENENVQKVYWIDGEHQPRVINIVKANTNYNESSFDFIPELQLDENVTVSRITESYGVFSPGTIQYAFTYYNKYGSESNIFYTTEINYISHKDRGASPEDTINNSFKISIDNIDSNFEYIRIYSIHRSSINGTPQVKLVEDIKIDSLPKDDNNIVKLEYIDNNTTGSTVDPTLLLYIGGKEIIAQTLATKNNTLFLGNIKIKEPTLSNDIKSKLKGNYSIETIHREIELDSTNNSNYYHYSNQLQYGNTSTFKCGEVYRLGVQCQYKNGNWSEPVFIEDYTVDEAMRPKIKNNVLENNVLCIPEIRVTYKNYSDIKSELYKAGYRRIRTLVVFPEEYERRIVTQGILNPTVFNVQNRLDNAPFAQASWFFRPFISENFEDIDNNEYVNEGAVVEFRHNYCLHTPIKGGTVDEVPDITNRKYFRSSEIQNMYECPSLNDVTSSILAGNTYLNKSFFVDSSIVTLHSPDIEFNSSLNINDTKMRIVGITEINSNIGDIDITTSSKPIKSWSPGFYHKDFRTNSSSRSGRQLTSGFFYMDDVKLDDESTYGGNVFNSVRVVTGYLIFPWQKEGSLNNDISGNLQTGILNTKAISNLKFSKDNIWLSSNNIWEPRGDLLDIQKSLDIDYVSMLKLKSDSFTKTDYSNYYSNIDTILTSGNYPRYYNSKFDGIEIEKLNSIFNHNIVRFYKDYVNESIKQDEKYKHSSEPIRMRYKTMPHAILKFNLYDDKVDGKSYQEILPTVNKINIVKDSYVPFWEDETLSLVISQNNYINHEGVNLDDYEIITIEDASSISPLAEGTCHTAIVKTGKDQFSLYGCVEQDGSYTQGVLSYTKDTIPENFPTKYKVTNDDGSKLELFEYVLAEEGKYKLQKKSEIILRTTIPTYGGVNQSSIAEDNFKNSGSGLFLCELYRDNVENRFGGTSDSVLQQNLWFPANTSVKIDKGAENTLSFKYGDTWYQRYDCLKTIPWSNEDTNQVVDICSFMCETRVNIDGRYDKNRGLQSNLNINNTNFNLLNEVYTQKDNFFTYRYLPEDYYIDDFPNQIIWSKTKAYGNEIDDWTQVLLSSSLDVDNTLGSITALRLWNNNLLCFQNKGLSQIMYNERTTISTHQGVPIEIANSQKVDGNQYISNQIGCSNKETIQITQNGLYFVDSNTKDIYRWSKSLEQLSNSKGFTTYLNKNTINKVFHDPKLRDVYFQSDNECLIFNEQLGEFSCFVDYTMNHLLPLQDSLIAIKNNSLWKQFNGEYLSLFGKDLGYSIDIISAENPTLDKIFSTIEFRAEVLKGSIQDAESQHTSKDNKNILPFTKIRAWNEYQDTGECEFKNTPIGNTLSQRFRIWRGNIPRVGFLDRVRNPWARIKLYDEGSNKNTVIHDIAVTYF